MAHDRDLGSDDGADHLDAPATPFELHRAGAGADEPGGVPHRLVRVGVVAHPGQVADNKSAGPRPRHRSDVMDHLVHPDVQRVLVSEHDLGKGVTDEDDVDTAGIDKTRPRLVVGGDHDKGSGPRPPFVSPDRGGGHVLFHASSFRPAPRGCRRSVSVEERRT